MTIKNKLGWFLKLVNDLKSCSVHNFWVKGFRKQVEKIIFKRQNKKVVFYSTS